MKKTKIKYKKLQLVNKLLLGLIIFTGVGFIIVTNDIAVQGFVLAELKTDLLIMEKANAEYELTALRLESMANVNERAKELKMVKVNDVEYISVTDTSVAIK
ncbi:hypothetical protein KAJ89_02065 [Candidatus Parcubacteria bacterium]|nr:hypothetical protein [Candidatus Parcubacteria bacterium]